MYIEYRDSEEKNKNNGSVILIEIECDKDIGNKKVLSHFNGAFIRGQAANI